MVSYVIRKKSAQKMAVAAAKRGGKPTAAFKATTFTTIGVEKISDGVSALQISDRIFTDVLCSHPQSRNIRIQECDREEQEDATPSVTTYKGLTLKHFPTPISNARKRSVSSGSGDDGDEDGSVSCNKCRPT